MCRSYEQKTSHRELSRQFRHLQPGMPELPRSEEVFARDPVLILTGAGERIFSRSARWGLVGSFLDRPPREPLINLRSEGLATTPFYSRILKHQRCLIPASAFFEWQGRPDNNGHKLRISHDKGKTLMFAGIFDTHPNAGTTCAILTVPADGVVAPNNDRMPLMLDSVASAFWLQEHAEFPEDDYIALTGLPAPRLKTESIAPPEISPQLAFEFA
jgi:putative SOS response-associated peptidase YedK